MTVGSVTVPLGETLRVLLGQDAQNPRWGMVIRDLRLPRTLTAITVGAALGIAGLQMQTLFRNALADPYILGASSGASLGVALVVVAGGGGASGFTANLAGLGRTGVVIAAALGAAAVLMMIVVLSRWVRSAVTLLLIGVMLGSATTAVVSVLLVYADPQRAQQFLVWGLGSFTATTWSDLKLLVPVVVAGIVIALLTVRALNALLLGEGYARSMGIDIRVVRLRRWCRLHCSRASPPPSADPSDSSVSSFRTCRAWHSAPPIIECCCPESHCSVRWWHWYAVWRARCRAPTRCSRSTR